MEKANAGGNSPDTRETFVTVKINSRTFGKRMLLNSKCLNEASNRPFNRGVWIQDLPKGDRFYSSQAPANYHTMGEEVGEKQRELMELARNKGKYDKTVLDRQLLLARSKLFRRYAVEQISRKSGSQTPGVDKEIYDKTDETMCESLVEYLREIIYHPNKYKANAIKRV